MEAITVHELCQEGGAHFRLTSVDKIWMTPILNVLFIMVFKASTKYICEQKWYRNAASHRWKAIEKSLVVFHILQNSDKNNSLNVKVSI